MTKKEKVKTYETLINSQQTIESSMHRTLQEQLTAEIVLRTVTKFDFAIEWVRSTFMYIRVLRNPKYYGSQIIPGDDAQASELIKSWCMKTLEKLYFLGMINLKEDNESFDATYLAKIVIRNSISLRTTDELISILGEPHNLKQLLEMICKTKEMFRDVILRVSEKRFLNELNKQLRFKHKEKIKTNIMKINCLLQVNLFTLRF